jgi:LmbE family N-acetylglucosaminyl deacetylase
VAHVFVSPHPDDVALSCGGLIASLRASGESVTIVTVHGGAGSEPALTPYQVDALGFDDGRPIPTPDEAMGFRRAEDEAFGRYVGATMVQLLRPDGVFRGYSDNGMLSGTLCPRTRRRSRRCGGPWQRPHQIGCICPSPSAATSTTSRLAAPGSRC